MAITNIFNIIVGKLKHRHEHRHDVYVTTKNPDY